MGQDLKAYLDAVKRRKPDELHVVSRPIDPAYEITALVVKLEKERRKRPVLLFENVKGTRFPVLTNVHASRSRLAAALNCAPDAMLQTYLRAMEKPIAPRVVRSAPVHEVVLKGAEVDLYALPQIVHHQGDAGPYITAAISFAKDPASETWNCAYNRLMIQGRDTTSIHLTLGKHLWEFQQIAEQRGEALQLGLVIGVHPAIALGALAIGSIDEDERAIMGGLFGEPLELVKCQTSEVLVPAHGAMVPSVRAVRVPAPFTCYVSIEQRLVGQAKNAIMAVFGADLYMKRVVVVDHDVDVFDDRQISWALATRCQPDRDITLVTHARGSDLDPSTREDGYTAKWGVDATAKPSLGG